jgi:dipeptidyl aminopeptidase/acylaminoacyl peptidase
LPTKKRPVAIDDLYRIVLVGDAQISSDGTKVTYVQRAMDREKDDYVTNVWLWEDGATRQYTSGDKDSTPRWSPDGRSLAFLSKRDETGKVRLFVLHADGGEALPLTDKEWDVSSIVWSPDGNRIAFVRSVPTDEHGVPKEPESDEDDDQGKNGKKKKKPAPTKITERIAFKADGVGFIWNRRRHVFVVNVESGETTQITDGDVNDESPAWSPDGEYIAFASDRNLSWDTEIDSQIWEAPAEGGEARQVVTERGSWGQPVYSPEGNQIAFMGDIIGDERPVTGFNRLWRINRDGTQLTDLTGDSDLEAGNTGITDAKLESQEPFVWDDGGIWFLATTAGAGNIYRWREGIEQVTVGDHDIRDFSRAGDRLAYTRADANHPAEIFWSDIPGQDGARPTPTQLTAVNEGLLGEIKISTPEAVSFPGSGGQQVEGWLIRPPLEDDLPHPMILYIHGGPQAAYGYSFFHEMQVLAGLGFGVLLINPHGSSSHGESWVSSIQGDWGNRDFDDVMKATDMVAALDWVDEKRLAIAGGSYGGYMTSWTIGHTDRFAAAVIERSLVNMLSFVGTTDVPNWWQYAWRATIEDDPMKLWKMSPIAYLKQMSTPALIIHSENDHRCPVEQGEQIFVGLRRRGVPTRFVRFPEESHGLSRGGKPSRRIERLNEIVAWLTKYLAAE